MVVGMIDMLELPKEPPPEGYCQASVWRLQCNVCHFGLLHIWYVLQQAIPTAFTTGLLAISRY